MQCTITLATGLIFIVSVSMADFTRSRIECRFSIPCSGAS